MKTRFIGFILGFLLISTAGICSTDVSGNQSGTWALVGSPYNVTGDITVPAGYSLVIEPGVQVVVQGDYQINAEGYIVAQGTISDTIKFYGQETTTWQGLRLEDETNQSTFSYCKVSDTDGINSSGIHSVDSPVSIQNCFFDNHRKAVNLSAMGEVDPPYMEIIDSYITTCEQCGILVNENSNALIDGCEITQCGQGTSYWPGIQLTVQNTTGECNPTITNNYIHHNDKQGITLSNIYNYREMAPHIENNTIEYNLSGVYLYNGQGYYKDNYICYNFISGNPDSGAGVMLYGSGTNGTFVGNEIAYNFCGFYCVSSATSNLGDLSNGDPDDDGGNNIHDNVDGGGTTYSVYNGSALDIKAENNYWDSEDYTEIAATIIDGNDNPSYGFVDFDPIHNGVGIDLPQDEPISINIENFPNPFRSSIAFSFSLAKSADISIEIYNVKGQKIISLCSHKFDTGQHSVQWNGKNNAQQTVPSGIYFYYAKENGRILHTGRCLFLK